MGWSLPVRRAADARVRRSSSSKDWKDRWTTWLVRSTIAAAVVHAVLFALWPMWNITTAARDDNELEAVQLRPVASFGALTDVMDSPTTALRTADEIEFDLARAGGAEEDADALDEQLEKLAALKAAVVTPVEPVATGTTIVPENLALDLEFADINERFANLPDMAYPLIRNPVTVVRFLRSKYNPVHEAAGPQGTVTVAMWVNERGSVDWSEVRQSSGHAVLDQIALALFNDIAVFRAARSGGVRVSVPLVISVPLSLPW